MTLVAPDIQAETTAQTEDPAARWNQWKPPKHSALRSPV